MSSYMPLPASTSGAPQQARFNLPLPWRYPPPSSTAGQTEYEKPSLLQAITARPLRLLLWSCALVVALFLLSGSLGKGPAAEHVGKIGSYAQGSYWKARKHTGGRELPHNEALLDPELTRDPKTGFLLPPDVYPAAMNPFKRSNAAFVSLVRNQERESFRDSMRSIESRFNRKFGYPWVLFNDVPFEDSFKTAIRRMTRSEVSFHTIPKEHWGYPAHINQTAAKESMAQMGKEGVIYGDNLSYRHMCRFNSGFFYRQEALASYDYYWRIEPGVEFKCDIDYDPFLFMEANNKVYGFTMALYEYERTIQSLWKTVKDFAKLHPEHIHPENAQHILVDDPDVELQDSSYNMCHFWSNFEIADLRFWRGPAYTEFFDYLDATSGFFEERWGDAPVHSIAAALFLDKKQLHKFEDIAYRHNPYESCPTTPAFQDTGKCECDPASNFDNDGYSCTKQTRRVLTPWLNE